MVMDEITLLKRKLVLKKQAVSLINEEVRDLQIRLALHRIKEHLEAKMNQGFDISLSRKLDCINYLIEN
jgi:hypothetical protein